MSFPLEIDHPFRTSRSGEPLRLAWIQVRLQLCKVWQSFRRPGLRRKGTTGVVSGHATRYPIWLLSQVENDDVYVFFATILDKILKVALNFATAPDSFLLLWLSSDNGLTDACTFPCLVCPFGNVDVPNMVITWDLSELHWEFRIMGMSQNPSENSWKDDHAPFMGKRKLCFDYGRYFWWRKYGRNCSKTSPRLTPWTPACGSLDPLWPATSQISNFPGPALFQKGLHPSRGKSPKPGQGLWHSRWKLVPSLVYI